MHLLSSEIDPPHAVYVIPKGPGLRKNLLCLRETQSRSKDVVPEL